MCVIKTLLIGIITRIYKRLNLYNTKILELISDVWELFLAVCHSIAESSWHNCSQAVLASISTHTEDLCSSYCQVESVTHFEIAQRVSPCSPPVLKCKQLTVAQSIYIGSVFNLFGQRTQVNNSFVFVIIKTLYHIRMIPTNSPLLMMTNQMTILTF